MPFKGIEKLRSAEESIVLTKEQTAEWIKCSEDPIYFIKTYFNVLTMDGGLSPFLLHQFQEDLIRFYLNNRFSIGRIPRQMGKSSVAAAFILWHAIFHKEKVHALIANKLVSAKRLLAIIKDAYKELPLWLQCGIVSWTTTCIDLVNGSKIFCGAGLYGVKAMTIDFLYVDEFAYFPKHIADDFIASVIPTIASSSTSRFIIASTTKGANHFYELWEEAVQGKGLFVPIRLFWHQLPGRDDLWASEQIRFLGQERFNQEFNCEFFV